MRWQPHVFLLSFSSLGFASVMASLWPRQSCNDSPNCFWDDYPACSEQCHVSNWPSTTCYPDNLNDACLCPDVAWQTANAQCIGQHCNSELQDAAGIYSTNCMNNGDSLGISEADFVSIGQAAASAGATSSTTAPTSSSVPTSTTSAPSSSPTSNGNGIDSETRTNIILGTVIPGISLIVAAIGVYFGYKARKQRRHRYQSPSLISEVK